MKESNSFGALLKRYRLEVGLSQEALAERASLSARAISDLERGVKHTPRFDTLDLLTDALALSEQQRALLRASARPELAPPPAAPPPAPPTPPTLPALPLAPTTLIGREQECSQAQALLRGTEVRLLTITGPGGVGKTRLALALAHDLAADFSDGVAFVALAPVHTVTLVPEVIAQTLGLHEQVGTPMAEQVLACLQSRHLLLVLDNCEHLLEAASFVATLLERCAQLSILATSRTPLRLRAEQVFPLAALAPQAAVRLFCQRAQAIRPGSSAEGPTVAAICERLDRLPLAIELAAMQVRALSVSDLLERLKERLSLLREGARDLPARQQTMEAAIAWSYELLPVGQQRCLRALGVFVGGWTLAAAEAVCWGEGERRGEAAILSLAGLVDGSLVQVESVAEGGTRFTMLELIREYALERLREAGEEAVCRRRHAAYYARLGESVPPFGPGQGGAEARLAQEFPNARAALEWAEAQGEVELGLRLVAPFSRFWFVRGQMSEAEGWLERMLALERQAGEQQALFVVRAQALYHLGEILLSQGKLERAEALARGFLEHARQSQDHAGMFMALSILGMSAKTRGQFAEAATYYSESEAHARQTEDLSIQGTATRNRTELAMLQGDVALASALIEADLVLTQAQGIPFLSAVKLTLLGQLARQQQNYPLAKTRYREALLLYRSVGSPTYTALCLEGYAAALCVEERYALAARLCAAAASFRQEAHTPLPPDEREAVEQTVTTARAAVGEPAFAHEWATGSAYTQIEAIDYALSER